MISFEKNEKMRFISEVFKVLQKIIFFFFKLYKNFGNKTHFFIFSF
jgi:hypothetical protein